MSTGGVSKARLGRMHAVMAGYVERGEVPGIVTLVSRRSEVHIDAIGMMAIGCSDPIRRDTIFRISGRFGWDGGFGTSWSSDPKEDMVTILMTQRLGFPQSSGCLSRFLGPRPTRRPTTEARRGERRAHSAPLFTLGEAPARGTHAKGRVFCDDKDRRQLTCGSIVD